jgi:hypothetical protein
MSNRRKTPTPAPAPKPQPKVKPWQSRIGEVLLALAGDTAAGVIPRRPFAPPALPPGVVPKGGRFALDNAANTANYGWLNGQPDWCGLGFPGYTYLSELAQRSEVPQPQWTNGQGNDARVGQLHRRR